MCQGRGLVMENSLSQWREDHVISSQAGRDAAISRMRSVSATERHVLRWPSRACVEVRMETPFGRLRFLYVGARDMDQDLAYYRSVLGAERVWHFEAFGALVAAVRLGEGPLFLLADHRPAP